MTILITHVNKEYFLKKIPTLKFTPSTTNTSTFNISEKKFIKLRDEIKAEGVNPYAAMSW